MIEIPLSGDFEQIFSITLSDEVYDIRVIYNTRIEPNGVWSISISQNGTAIISGVALVGGVDIFDQYNIPIKNAYVINLDNPKLDPTVSNLGSSSKLVILTDEEVTLIG